jgi:hypothetical protein
MIVKLPAATPGPLNLPINKGYRSQAVLADPANRRLPELSVVDPVQEIVLVGIQNPRLVGRLVLELRS